MKLVFALALFVACTAVGTIPEHGGRIINGQVAKKGQFPYQVALLLQMGNQTSWCGGTLISDRWVLTAAHCTIGADAVKVYLGAHNIEDDSEHSQQHIYVPKAGIFAHEKYDGSFTTDDIALIKLPVPVEFNDLIQPALLPKKNAANSTFVGNTVISSGWGRVSDSNTSMSPVLNYIHSYIISSETCSNYFMVITPNMICISGKEGLGTCNGDSGGPLIYKDNGKNILIGATSFGTKLGCEAGFPNVFTRITSYLDWI